MLYAVNIPDGVPGPLYRYMFYRLGRSGSDIGTLRLKAPRPPLVPMPYFDLLLVTQAFDRATIPLQHSAVVVAGRLVASLVVSPPMYREQWTVVVLQTELP